MEREEEESHTFAMMSEGGKEDERDGSIQSNSFFNTTTILVLFSLTFSFLTIKSSNDRPPSFNPFFPLHLKPTFIYTVFTSLSKLLNPSPFFQFLIHPFLASSASFMYIKLLSRARERGIKRKEASATHLVIFLFHRRSRPPNLFQHFLHQGTKETKG